MAEQILLLGGGGHGRVVLDALLAGGVDVTGILDPNLEVSERVFGVPVLGGDGFLEQVSPGDVILINGLGANPQLHGRKRLFEDLKMRGFRFAMVRHPSTVFGRECCFSAGSQIMAGAVLQSRVNVAENAVINTRASIDHDCTIGAHAFIAPGAVLCGDVEVAGMVFVGAGAVVLPGIRIGENAVVGAGSVVTRTIPEGCIVAGNPAVRIGENN